MTLHERQHGGRDALGVSVRTDRVVSWIGWHLGELAGIAVPAVLACTVSGWFAVVSAGVLAGWVLHEVRTGRQRRTRSGVSRVALPPAISDHTEDEEVPGETA